MKTFVTGGTGFIGRRLVAALLERGHEVTVLVRPGRQEPDGLPSQVRRLFADLTDRDALGRAEGADVLFNLGAIYELGTTNASRMEDVNVGGTRNVLELAVNGRIGLVIHVSSMVVLGPANKNAVTEESESDGQFRSEYERTKWLAHRAAVEAARRGARVRIALPGAVYGPEDPSLLGGALRLVARGLVPWAFFQNLVLSPVHVDDVVSGLIRIAEEGRDGRSYLLAGEPITQGKVFELWAGLCGRRGPRFLPDRLAVLGSYLVRCASPILKNPAALAREVVAMSHRVSWAADSSRARVELGWKPRPLEEGLKSMAYEASWPSPWQTWLRYFFIGRWNYLKGTLLAGLLATLLWFLVGPRVAIIVLCLAPAYIFGSGLGLYLLYGHPEVRFFRRLFSMAKLEANERIADIHFGTYRGTRGALSELPGALVSAVDIADRSAPAEEAVRDVWGFEKAPLGHPRLKVFKGSPGKLPLADGSADVVMLGFGIHEVDEGKEREELFLEIQRVLAPGGRVVLFERGWSPLLFLVFGPLFLHFTPGRKWEQTLRRLFPRVERGLVFGMVDIFVASRAPPGER
jgi:nucleoside-diphosphate-sugar epimerase